MQSADVNGWLVLDKPGGSTSRDAVNRIQRSLPRNTKIGHTGTLDPLATGVLVICLGHATRLAEYVQAMRKTYRSTFLLGATSDTDDADGIITLVSGSQPRAREDIETAMRMFIGEIDQVPPAYSAAKLGGRRAYDLARAGEEVEIASRRVTVYGIELLAYSWPRLDIEIHCGTGTYIRSIARELGRQLGCGALVEVLRRTRVGPFTADEGLSVDADAETIRRNLRSMLAGVSELPHVNITAAQAQKIRHGQALAVDTAEHGAVAVVAEGQLVAIAHSDGQILRPTKVIPAGPT